MIRAGQIYTACDPRDLGADDHPRRIRVVQYTPFRQHVTVETVTADGTGSRTRRMAITGLHTSATTMFGEPRRRGYVLTEDGAQ